MTIPIVYKPLTSNEVFGKAIDEDINSATMTDGTHCMVGQRSAALASLINFVGAVLTTSAFPYTIDQDPFGMTRATPTEDFLRRSMCLSTFGELYAEDFSYSPDIALFFDIYRSHVIRKFRGDDPNGDVGNGMIVAELHNDFVACMRAEATKRGTRRKLADWKRNSDKNLRSLRLLTEGIFARKARVLVVRVDLLYRCALVDKDQLLDVHEILTTESADASRRFYDGWGLRHVPKNRARQDVRQARDDMEAFLKLMRTDSLFEHLEGYAWKLEYSRWGGFHYHCVFFFDGSKVMNDVCCAKWICELWEGRATKGRGYGHNCNQDRRRYRCDGIGMVDHADLEKRAKLDRALSYLAKRDQHVRVKLSAKCRVFQTAGRTFKKGGNAGRPRRVQAAVGLYT
ncbi:YagK/YfjJ domain-containing protein [Pandoraea apista]|uniref:YagK/YfjJ domain-containing protein n=1 Tax=Pandoraea apista TaxID=93218 RepID=UPI000F685AB9|nr:inovirus-type Gp2 protein [Pandoraea apista]RRW87964.1 inovirus Gp2 family protein [Pandoraea apista]RRW96722.1 inovirus Gp2 family protein [Pandoraea apista]